MIPQTNYAHPKRLPLIAGLLALTLAAGCSAANPTASNLVAPTPFDPAVTLPATQEAAPATDAPPASAEGCAALDTITAVGGQDVSNWMAYCDDYFGFGFKYPPGGQPTPPTESRVILYLPVLPDTTLLEKYILVEPAEGVTECASTLAEGYESGFLQTEQFDVGGMPFAKQVGGDAGAGSIYDWMAYSTAQNGNCVTLSFVLHHTNADAYATPPAEFDPVAETAVFETILATLTWLP